MTVCALAYPITNLHMIWHGNQHAAKCALIGLFPSYGHVTCEKYIPYSRALRSACTPESGYHWNGLREPMTLCVGWPDSQATRWRIVTAQAAENSDFCPSFHRLQCSYFSWPDLEPSSTRNWKVEETFWVFFLFSSTVLVAGDYFLNR